MCAATSGQHRGRVLQRAVGSRRTALSRQSAAGDAPAGGADQPYGNGQASPQLYDSQGRYRGNLSRNPYDPNAASNPYSRFGSPYSPYRQDSPNNPYGQGIGVYRNPP